MMIKGLLKALFGNSCLLLLCVYLNGCTSPTAKNTSHKVYTVEIKEMKFQPAELTVEKGDTVLWINHDFVDHDITEEKNKEWSSSVLPAGKSWQMVITKNADYYCSIHQVMKGKLVVK